MPGRIHVAKPLKYRNKPVRVGGVYFSSKKEAARWGELQLLEASGQIRNLRRQVRYPLTVRGFKVCDYYADAVYEEGGKTVVEDTKSPATRKNPVFRLKCKLMRAIHGIEIREV